MKKNQKNEEKVQKEEPLLRLKDEASFLEDGTVASATECTGLMPSAPSTEEEAEEYQDIYAVPAPPQRKDSGKQSPDGSGPRRKS